MNSLIRGMLLTVLFLNIGTARMVDGFHVPVTLNSILPPKCSFKDENPSVFVSQGSFMFDRLSTGFGIRGKKFGVEIGFTTPKNTMVFSNPFLPVINYRCPHNDYNSLQVLQSIYVGLDGLYFFNLNKRVSLYTGVGLYFSDLRQRVRSNATGWIYDHGSVGTLVGVNPQIGIQFFVGKSGNYLGINFGLHRGLGISYGMKRL